MSSSADATETSDNIGETTRLNSLQEGAVDCMQEEDIKNPEVYKKRLRAEMLHRDADTANIDKQTNAFTLSFNDDDLEKQYRNSTDTASCVSLLGLPLTLSTYLVAHLLVGPLRYDGLTRIIKPNEECHLATRSPSLSSFAWFL